MEIDSDTRELGVAKYLLKSIGITMVVTFIGTIGVGFGLTPYADLGWMTASTHQRIVLETRKEGQVELCILRARYDPKFEQKLRSVATWRIRISSQIELVNGYRWAEGANTGVARKCAEKLTAERFKRRNAR